MHAVLGQFTLQSISRSSL